MIAFVSLPLHGAFVDGFAVCFVQALSQKVCIVVDQGESNPLGMYSIGTFKKTCCVDKFRSTAKLKSKFDHKV